MKDFDPRDKIDSARMDLVLSFPVYGTVFLRMNVFEDPTCKTAWTDGVSIGYNVDYTASLTHEQIIGLFVHECLHVMLKHHLRAAANILYEQKHGRWNRACDYSLNPTIKKTNGMDLHPNWLYRPEWNDSLAEHIFDLLNDEPGDDQGGVDGTGNPLPGEVRPFPGKDGKPATAGEIEVESNKVDQMIRAAEFKAAGAGKLDGGAKDIIKKATAATVDWTEELVFLCTELSRDDYSFRRPNPRYMDQRVYMPTLSGTRTSDLIFFVDTSGSLTDNQLSKIMGEIRSIIEEFDIRVIVVYWDTGYRGHEIFDASDVLDPSWTMNTSGRGGTRFYDVWTWLEDNLWELDIDPKGIIFFSDLECRAYPAEEPGLPLIWCQTPDSYGRFEHSYIKHLPDYGKRVLIPVQRR